MPRFFSANSLSAYDAPGQLKLEGPIAAHMRVLRLRAGDAVTLFDGSGEEWRGKLIELSKRDAVVTIEEREVVSREATLPITLVQSLTAADKLDWIVQKATELGVARMVLVRSARSALSLDAERAQKKLAHWQGVAIAACEQCGRNRLPDIVLLVDLHSALREIKGTSYVLDPTATNPLPSAIEPHAEGVTVFIGPEGGFASEELALLAGAAVRRVSMGQRILRAETASIAAISAIHAVFGDFD